MYKLVFQKLAHLLYAQMAGLTNSFSVFIVLGIDNFGLSSKKEGGNNKEKTFERRLLMVSLKIV